MLSSKFSLKQDSRRFPQGVGGWLIVVGGSVFLVFLWFVSEPIPQDLRYHDFADQRLLFGIPNALNVVSNLFFLVFGYWGLRALRHRNLSAPLHAWLYAVFFVGIGLIGLGSAYYHWSPSNTTLVWDRLPMTIGFMAFTALVFYERVSPSVGKTLFPWLLLFGVLSVTYWVLTDDLRPYAAVQFIPLVTLPVVIAMSSGPGTRWLWLTLSCYVLAKLLELNDQVLMDLSGGQVSGHTLKHVAAAFGALMMAIKVRRGEFNVPGQAG